MTASTRLRSDLLILILVRRSQRFLLHIGSRAGVRLQVAEENVSEAQRIIVGNVSHGPETLEVPKAREDNTNVQDDDVGEERC